MDILMRVQGRVVKISEHGPSQNVVEVEVGEFNELMVEIVRLRSVLEGIGERSELYSSVTQLQKMARDGILPEDE